MVEFETIKAEEISYGNQKFIEIARKKAITDEGENEFISVSSGFTTETGEKRYKKSFTVPMEQSVVDFIGSQLKEMLAAGSGAAPPAPEEPAPAAAESQEAPANDEAQEETQ